MIFLTQPLTPPLSDITYLSYHNVMGMVLVAPNSSKITVWVRACVPSLHRISYQTLWIHVVENPLMIILRLNCFWIFLPI